jgi:hypothetical protein
MRELGFREWTALAALVFGVLLAFVFLDPAASDSGERPPLKQGEAPPTATIPAPTPEPPSQLPSPDGWGISFASIINEQESVEGTRVLPVLDLTFERAPFPDYRDDSWKVTASTSVTMGAGTSLFTLEYDCAIRVFIDDREIASRDDPEGPQDLVVTFPHESGNFTIRVEATDVGGPFRLGYK